MLLLHRLNSLPILLQAAGLSVQPHQFLQYLDLFHCMDGLDLLLLMLEEGCLFVDGALQRIDVINSLFDHDERVVDLLVVLLLLRYLG